MEKQTKEKAIKEAVKKCPYKKECKKEQLTKEEKDWVLGEIEVNLNSYRCEAKIRGLNFRGTFSEDLPKEERKIMKSIYNKLNSEVRNSSQA